MPKAAFLATTCAYTVKKPYFKPKIKSCLKWHHKPRFQALKFIIIILLEKLANIELMPTNNGVYVHGFERENIANWVIPNHNSNLVARLL